MAAYEQTIQTEFCEVTDALAYLDAQRQTFAAEQAAVQTRLTQATNTVDLYVTLGGGLMARSRSGS